MPAAMLDIDSDDAKVVHAKLLADGYAPSELIFIREFGWCITEAGITPRVMEICRAWDGFIADAEKVKAEMGA